ncbi:hypothetical protein LIER_18322 [Lithospermum erythrorhizon]|uniref:FAS1 domain-containing protein n=1 Tax=Lithospermum erythrorhizon TaxID=34254 RepID=A0AAV3QGQ8_LITER
MSPSTAVCSILALGFLLSATNADPISKILDAYPDFSKLNQLLVSSGIDQLIDKEAAVTILALDNDEIEKLSGLKKPKEMEDIIKAHVARDYYDDVKLRHLNFGQPQEVVNMLQSNGTKQGFLKIIRTEDGITFQSSGRPSNPSDAKFVDRIYARQFSVSVLKISHTIFIDGLTGEFVPADAPISTKTAKAPAAEAPEEVVAEVPNEELPEAAPAPGPEADDDAAADAKSAAGKATFGLATVIIAASCIAAAL